MTKKKWTRGWLCRDEKRAKLCYPVTFFPCVEPKMKVDGAWQTPCEMLWKVQDFLRHYKAADLPGYGKCVLVDMEL